MINTDNNNTSSIWQYHLLLKADISSFARIRELLLNCGLPRTLAMELCVTAEEIFINICSYAFDDPDGKQIEFLLDPGPDVVLRFIDSGKPYDPRTGMPTADEYDIDSQIGGLGKVIIFSIADKADYEYKDGKNILTITKHVKEVLS